MYINYSDIPGYQNLFLDYLYEFDNVAKFYPKNFRNTSGYAEHFNKLKFRDSALRKSVAQIVQQQHQGEKLSRQTELNIRLLKEENTIAIITGQQVGIFGGPLYTFYKTITTIKLAQQLQERFVEFNFVPIFWLETEDHDFTEIAKVFALDKQNKTIQLNYDDGLLPEENRGSVGKLKFNENIQETVTNFLNTLQDTEYKKEISELLSSSNKQGVYIKDAFKYLLRYFFDENGLIIFDPYDSNVKKLLKPIFKKEITNFRKHTATAVETSADLEETYHAQVKVKPINLFMNDDTGRYLIEPVEEEYRLRTKRKRISHDNLIAELESTPEKFSPNVLLRPICQDYLFPTGAYIGGPSEICYFAQVNPLYKYFNVEPPFLFPRASVTLLEKNVDSILTKLNIELNELFLDEHVLKQKIVRNESEFELGNLFETSETEIKLIFDRIKEQIFGIDKTLIETAMKTEQRVLQSLDNLRVKSEKADERKHEIVIRQIEKVRNILFPNNTLQERVINFSYFTNKYGLDIVKWLFNQIIINKFEHQIIDI